MLRRCRGVASGTIAENVHLGHDREVRAALRAAQRDDDVTAAGGVDAVVGHRGLRLSAGRPNGSHSRVLAARADLLVLDEVSSALDATTEGGLWNGLGVESATIIAATSRQAILARADRVVVLHAGFQVAVGRWADLRHRWGHLAWWCDHGTRIVRRTTGRSPREALERGPGCLRR